MHLAAHHNLTPENLRAIPQLFPMRPDRQVMTGRAILTRAVVHVEDLLTEPEYATYLAQAGGFRSALAVPMLAAKITRQLRLLRAHGIVQKIAKTHRYKLSPKGQLLTAALFAAREATLTQLIGHAA